MAMGTWELVERPRGVNVMKNRWVLMTKYHIDDTVARKKAHLVVKGFTQVYGADYDEAYAPVGSYVTLRIFLSIVVVLYMYQPVYYDDGTGRVYKPQKYVRVEADAAAVSDLLGAGLRRRPARRQQQPHDALKELMEAAFELRKISPVENYLELEIVRDRPARKLWWHYQSYVDKLRRCFIDKERTWRISKTPVSVDTYAELTFDDEDAQEHEEEEYW
ncbi:unnamed protein product [Closterium sp. NIES-53]